MYLDRFNAQTQTYLFGLFYRAPNSDMTYVFFSTRRFVVCLTLRHFVLVFFSPFSIAITSLGEERANLSAFRTFDRFVLVWICRFPLPLGVWEGLRFVIVALPGPFSYHFFYYSTLEDSIHLADDTGTVYIIITGDFNVNMLNSQFDVKLTYCVNTVLYSSLSVSLPTLRKIRPLTLTYC